MSHRARAGPVSGGLALADRTYFEAPQGLIETDGFDCRSRHAVLRHRASGTVVGTVRLVLMDPAAPDSSFPLQKELRHVSPAAPGILRLALVRGLVGLSGELGITHWCALMEPTRLRLLRSTAMHFEPHGPLVEHHGRRQPSLARLETFLGNVGTGRQSGATSRMAANSGPRRGRRRCQDGGGGLGGKEYSRNLAHARWSIPFGKELR